MKAIANFLGASKSSIFAAMLIFSASAVQAQPGNGRGPGGPAGSGGPGGFGAPNGRPGPSNGSIHHRPHPGGNPGIPGGNPGVHGGNPRVNIYLNTPSPYYGSNYWGNRGYGYGRGNGFGYGYGYNQPYYGGWGPQFNFEIHRRPAFVCSHPGSPHTRSMERRIHRREFRMHMRKERMEYRRMRR